MLRVSLTDRCNFRCVYCMPEEGMRWLAQSAVLSFEEIAEIARAAVGVHGITRFKLTGGEPTVRRGLCDLVGMLRKISGVDEISMTTNGQLLESLARPLREVGLDRVTVSVDSLRPARFRQITRTGDLATVLRGLDALESAGFAGTKINCVTMRGVNDDELADFARLSIDRPVTVRFIEYMPLGDAALLGPVDDKRGTGDGGGAPSEGGDSRVASAAPSAGDPAAALGAAVFQTHAPSASPGQVADEETGPAGGCGAQDRGADALVPEGEVRAAIERELGALLPVDRGAEPGVGPATVYVLDRPGVRGRVGFISAMSEPFCSTCNRLRLTATGVLRSCLFEGGEVDLKPILRPTGEALPGGPTAGNSRSGDTRSGDARSGNSRSSDSRSGDTRSGDARSGNSRSSDTRSGDSSGGAREPAALVWAIAPNAPAGRAAAIAQAMTDCVRLKPDVHTARGSEAMSRVGG